MLKVNSGHDIYFLSKRRLLIGFMLSIFENVFSRTRQLEHFEFEEGMVVCKLKSKPSNWNNSTNIIFRLKKNKIVIVKKLKFKFKNLAYRQLMNEIGMFEFLAHLGAQKVNKHIIKFPKVYKVLVRSNTITFAREYKTGKKLSELSTYHKVNLINLLLLFYANVSNNLEKKYLSRLPKRGYLYIILSFPYYLVVALLKNFHDRSVIFALVNIFVSNLNISRSWSNRLHLAHRDLHSQNLIINKKEIYIIDPEICVLAEKLTDLAIIARVYFNEVGQHYTEELLKINLENKTQFSDFMRLTVFYTLQILANYDRYSPDYRRAAEFAKYILGIQYDKL